MFTRTEQENAKWKLRKNRQGSQGLSALRGIVLKYPLCSQVPTSTHASSDNPTDKHILKYRKEKHWVRLTLGKIIIIN